MSNHHGHHQSRRRRKNPINEFLDRLRGRKHQKSYRRTDFPGINLPKDYDPVTWKETGRFEKDSSKAEEIPEQEMFNKEVPEIVPEIPAPHERRIPRPSSSNKKKSIFDAFDLYLKQRELRREDRFKEKLRKKHRQKSEQEFRKINKGPGLRKKLFTLPGEELEGVNDAKQIPLLSQRNPIYRNMTIVVNSTLIFITTYILTYLFYWLTCMLVASFYGLDSSLFYYDLRFNDHSPLWNRLNILMVTGLPPFLCLILALFLFQYIFKLKRFVGMQKLFILWSAFHLFNHFFGALPSGIVTDEGFGYVAAWLYLNTAFKFMFSLISLFVLGAIGFVSAKYILETSDSMHRIKGDNRLSFLLYQLAIPWLAGTIIMLMLRIPENFNYPYETLMFFSMAFMIFPPFFNAKVKPELNLLKIKKKRNINIGYLFMMLVLVAFLRIMLGIGLHFIIEISISISPASG
jgi:hypothetical protein